MKITILLSCLASIAMAVPTNRQTNHLELDSVLNNIPTATKREKKSPLQDHTAAFTHEDTENIEEGLTSGTKSSHMDGRHTGLQKPIIIKKKIGYHLYRNSDEEMANADPHENCRKQVKVKLCDYEHGSPKNVANCFTSERLNEELSDKEIENRIKTAKEAVENVQRVLQKNDHSSMKMANIEDKNFEDDIEVHQNIEAARQALEHVQNSFGNLENLGSQVSVANKVESHPKSLDEKRLAQWKEAINNIQKNFEIARNIEDTFKVESEETHLLRTDTSDLSKTRQDDQIKSVLDETDTLNKQRENSESEMVFSPTEQKNSDLKLHSDSLKSEKITETPSDNHDTTKIQKADDHLSMMRNSQLISMLDDHEVNENSHNQESKAANENNLTMLKLKDNEKLKSLENEEANMKIMSQKNALSDTEDIDLSPQKQSSLKTDSLAKSAQIESVTDSDKLKQIENDMDIESTNINAQLSHLEAKHSLNNEKETPVPKKESLSKENKHDLHEHMSEMHELHDPLMMRFDHQSDSKIHPNVDTAVKTDGLNNLQHISHEYSSAKKADDMSMNLRLNPNEMNSVLNSVSMSISEEKQDDDHLNNKFSKTADIDDKDHKENEHTSMRMYTSQNKGHQLMDTPMFREPSMLQWAHTQQRDHESLLSSLADEVKSDFDHKQRMFDEHLMARMEQHQNLRNQLTGNHNLHDHETVPQNTFGNNFNLVDSHDFSQQGSRMHDHLHIMKHAMPMDMDSSMQPSTHMAMRDSIGNPALDHKDMHWNHHHHAMARYGSSLPVGNGNHPSVGVFPNTNGGGSHGSIGVFPNSNAGCGIPLMLSCSPSVVTGSMAKAHPYPGPITGPISGPFPDQSSGPISGQIPGSIAGPAYRSGDDIMFYMKRDAKDIEDLPAMKIHKSSLPFNHKSELIFDKNQ